MNRHMNPEWEDNSYEDFPEYTVAGISENKKYIAIFPTDVQYDSSQEAGYRRMCGHVIIKMLLLKKWQKN
ncbi:MAG: hypothetical protein K2L07_10050 [Lachnospiraceae bacterium]|nr:hypothetical protein [Lachnospiraceae bacterium]